LKTISGWFFDEENRRVVLVEQSGQPAKYYRGPDTEGVIDADAVGEYILVDGQKRYWRGVIDREPIDQESAEFNLGFVILKPDALARNLDEVIIKALETAGVRIVATRRVKLTERDVRRLYPYFCTPEWETALLKYMLSGECICLIVEMSGLTDDLLSLRARIRADFTMEGEQASVVNLIHVSDSVSDALREARIFFDSNELAQFGG